jgi:hypothetical protein
MINIHFIVQYEKLNEDLQKTYLLEKTHWNRNTPYH